ncbi:MAG: aminotransferase class I/II-fold pyridoxal phosphate-dependent enzyme [Lachnospiraceae bacterium]|nr:aminotransferase class I/II-fold pyridoxal phosphate-dependent enzyme [Lachnospiraceae bacterium]
MKSEYYYHGSDIEKIKAKYNISEDDLINFAANVNPFGLSPNLKKEFDIDIITSYPNRQYTELKTAIAEYTNSSVENVLVGNGTSELISTFIRHIHPSKAMIIGPTYSEYEREVSLSGGQSYYFPLYEEDGFKINADTLIDRLDKSIDMLIICNPNNPTSSCIDCITMRRILDVCKENHIYVMIDETYIEFVAEINAYSAVSLTDFYNNLIILRSTSKFFASPGLRLGYAIIGNEDFIAEINKTSKPWMVNSFAAKAGEIMLRDSDYIEKTNKLINEEREYCYNALLAADGFKPYKPYANFMLVKINKANLTSNDVFEKAIKQGMLIRNCSTFPFLTDEYFRFCFMEHDANVKLIDCITNC